MSTVTHSYFLVLTNGNSSHAAVRVHLWFLHGAWRESKNHENFFWSVVTKVCTCESFPLYGISTAMSQTSTCSALQQSVRPTHKCLFGYRLPYMNSYSNRFTCTVVTHVCIYAYFSNWVYHELQVHRIVKLQ